MSGSPPRKSQPGSAKELREAGKLWPQTCTDGELETELGFAERMGMDISKRMLQDEMLRRKREQHGVPGSPGRAGSVPPQVPVQGPPQASKQVRRSGPGIGPGIATEEIAQAIRLVREAREYMGDLWEGQCSVIDAKDWMKEADKLLKKWVDA